MSCTIRTIEELQALESLFDQYREQSELLKQVEALSDMPVLIDFKNLSSMQVTRQELIELVQRRRESISNELQNKGIKLALDTPEPLSSIRRQQASNAASEHSA